MSCLQNELILESLFEEVQEAFPYLSEEKQIEIATKSIKGRIIFFIIFSKIGYILILAFNSRNLKKT